MKSYKSANLITIKVPDTEIYLKTMNRGVLNWYEASSKAFVHDGQNRLRFQRQLFTTDRSRYVFNELSLRQIKSYKSVNSITIRVPDKRKSILKQLIMALGTSMRRVQRYLYMMDRTV